MDEAIEIEATEAEQVANIAILDFVVNIFLDRWGKWGLSVAELGVMSDLLKHDLLVLI